MTLIRRAILALALMAGLAPAFAQAPPPVPALPDTERRTSYSITGATCACAVNFALYGDSTDYQDWVEVYLNGVRVNFNDSTFGWTITSPTGSLATIPRPITDAVLTFNSAQTGTVQVVGARRPRRVSQFSENRGVAARDLNQALTDIIAQNREVWDKTNDVTGRALLSQPGNTLGLLPLPLLCSGKFLSFDVTGLIPQCLGGGPGSGNMVGPVSSVDNDFAFFSGTTGQLLKDGGTTLPNNRLANMNPGTIKGSNSGSPAAPIDLTGAQTTAMLTPVVGDSGSGGTQGLVPAPPSGSAAAAKVLGAGGSFVAPTTGLWQLFGNSAVSDVSNPNVAMDMTVSAVAVYNPVTGQTVTVPGATGLVTGINTGPFSSFRDVGGANTVTITIASPAVITDNTATHTNGDQVAFTTTGALPTGLTAGTTYFVVNKSGNTYQVSATLGGSAINTSGTQSGVQTATYGVYTVGQTVWFYWIWGSGPGLNTINSARAPTQANGGGTTGPILPTGYTHYAPAFPVIISDNATLQQIVVSTTRSTLTVVGNRAFYNGSLSRDFSNYFNGGATCAVGFKIVDYSSLVPVGATTVNVEIDSELHNGAATFIGGSVWRWGNSTCDNNNDLNLSLYVGVNSFVTVNSPVVDIPVNSSRAFWGIYLFSSGSITSSDTNMFFRGYSW